jgi:hypothetical protein
MSRVTALGHLIRIRGRIGGDVGLAFIHCWGSIGVFLSRIVTLWLQTGLALADLLIYCTDVMFFFSYLETFINYLHTVALIVQSYVTACLCITN